MNNPKKMTRRQFMSIAGGAAVHIGLPGVFIKLMDHENRALAAELRPDGRPRLPPGQHAIKAIVDMGGVQGPGRVPGWKLKIEGEIKKPTELGFEDLLALPRTKLTCDVHCVTGWTLLDSRWEGIRLTTLMERVAANKSVGFVIFEGHAGYSSSVPISEARKQNVILALNYADRPLPAAHGAPLRALVPDHYFYKSVKWLEGVKFSTVDEPGYYESRGYSNSADPWKEERFEESE